MKIHIHTYRQNPLLQIRCGPVSLTDADFAHLRLVAARFWFFVEDHADDADATPTVTIHGPTWVAPGYSTLADVCVRLPVEIAKVRLLSEVCCAMAASSEVFQYVRDPLSVPFTDDKNLISRTSAAFRKEHAGQYGAIAAEHALLYPQPVLTISPL